jgi:hypothetical protein
MLMTTHVDQKRLFQSSQSPDRPMARSREEIKPLLQLCREGRLYDVDRWITEGKPLQLAPNAISRGYRPPSALEIAIETGQHSLAFLILKNGYRLDADRHNPLDLALKKRRWDLFDLLLEWGADLKSTGVYSVLETYNTDLYMRFWASGYDLTQGHEMGATLGYSTSNRPLFGFAKRHRTEDPRIQTELNIALGYQVREGNEKGISLCLWAGADPHAAAPNPSLGIRADLDPEEVEEDHFIGWSAIEEAVHSDNLEALKRLGLDPSRDDFDELYRWAKGSSVVACLASIQPPKDLTSILDWQLRMMAHPWPGRRDGRWVVEALLSCGVRWVDADPDKVGEIRRSLLKLGDDDLRAILILLKRNDVCAVDTYLELIHTPSMRRRLVGLKLLKPQVIERRARSEEVVKTTSASRAEALRTSCPDRVGMPRTSTRFDRATLYEQVWSQPVQEVAKSYGISGRGLGKACQRLGVPVPRRGYWARVRNGYKEKKPPLPKLEGPISL